MIYQLSSYLWIFTTLFVLLSSFYLLLYFKFTSLKMLRSVKYISKDNIKLLNLSLAGKIGVGSISGIAISIIVGGKGTIFWIWLSSIFLSVFTYLETKAGIIYRENKIGGPFIYIKNVLGNERLSTIYILLIVFTYLFSFILIQSNTIIVSINNTFQINKYLIAVILIITIYISIKKEIERISRIVTVLVPFMGLLYLLIGCFIVVKNINVLPTILVDIFKDSFKIKSIASLPFIIGFQRSIFSNESGMGSTSMVVALSNNNDYEQEYFYQAIGMYYITLIVCTISALLILTSNYQQICFGNINGIEIINYAFNYHFSEYGSIISTIIITLFAFSTIITSFYYGDISFKYLFKNKNNAFVKIIVIIVVLLSLFINPINIWAVVDISTALTTVINVYSLIRIRKYLRR